MIPMTSSVSPPDVASDAQQPHVQSYFWCRSERFDFPRHSHASSPAVRFMPNIPRVSSRYSHRTPFSPYYYLWLREEDTRLKVATSSGKTRLHSTGDKRRPTPKRATWQTTRRKPPYSVPIRSSRTIFRTYL